MISFINKNFLQLKSAQKSRFEGSDKKIAYVRMPFFYLELLREKNRELIGKPVAIVEKMAKDPYVISSSDEATQSGVEYGMNLHKAKRYCKDLVYIDFDADKEESFFEDVIEYLSSFSPLIQPTKPGCLYIDFSGTERLFGNTVDLLKKIQTKLLDRYALSSCVGLASNKLLAKVASQKASFQECIHVSNGSEKSFLDPLPVSFLDSLNDSKESSHLRNLNIQTIGDLQRVPKRVLTAIFGKKTTKIKQEANGVDLSMVVSVDSLPSIQELIWIHSDENDDDILMGHLHYLIEKASFKLRKQNQQTSKLSFSLYYTDGVHENFQEDLSSGTAWDVDLKPVFEKLFYKACQRRINVRLLKIELLQLQKKGDSQLQFDFSLNNIPERNKKISVLQSLDNIRCKWGLKSIRFGIS